MGLLTCPDCGAQVSDAAPACVKCGRPIGKPAAAPVIVATGGNAGAAIASLLLPGLGQLSQGRPFNAALAFGLATALWLLTFGLLGWLGHVIAALDAAMWKPAAAKLPSAAQVRRNLRGAFDESVRCPACSAIVKTGTATCPSCAASL